MTPSFTLLLVEDNAEDAELEERELRRAGLDFRCRRVETEAALVQALGDFKPDLVISDYKLPTMNGLEALRRVRELAPLTPFIFVSGTIGEELATEALRHGATDYVVKGRKGALATKVERALSEAKERARGRQLEEQLRQSQKMEAIGRLAGGIAHDFNNLLTVINGFSELLLERMKHQPEATADLEQILGAGRRAAGLTRQLLAFSRKQVTQPVPLSLNDLVSGLVRMIERILGEDIELVLKLDPGLHGVVADPGQIEQVLLNLVVNARDAMPRGGRIELETRNAESGAEASAELPGRRRGAHAVLSVSDTGTGMSPETLEHLYEPFFTTKEPGKGTGLGLSTVHGIVIQSGGQIEVRSEAGKGTRFEIFLPKAEKPSTGAPSSLPPMPGARGSETILFAEDSDTVRALCERMLQVAGYRLLSARSGAEALALAKDHPDPIQLLITDTVMPGMGGAELAVRASRLRQGLRVLFITGYADGSTEVEELQKLGAALLQKPFGKEAFLAKVREILDAR